ncbi:hypothetical protein FRC01_006894 [Tulasnella sp. 417]|nr:hypothetical protein FRC01_006894 [Tulasnella sp. 417]
MSTSLLSERGFLKRHIGTKKNIAIINGEEALERAVAVFAQATNIVDLKFASSLDWTSQSDPFFKPIRLAVSKMSLKRLCLWECGDVDQILRSQPELEELEVGWFTSGVEQLEETDLPKLRCLAAPLHNAAYLVPGRPVEKFCLVLTFGDRNPFNDEHGFKNLSLSTGPIIEFSFHLFDSYEDDSYKDENFRFVLQTISRHLPQLERLTVIVAGSVSGRVILEEVPVFGALRCLTFLDANLTAVTAQKTQHFQELASDFSQSDGIIRVVPYLENWDDVFERLKQLCPLLVNTKATPRLFTCRGSFASR